MAATWHVFFLLEKSEINGCCVVLGRCVEVLQICSVNSNADLTLSPLLLGATVMTQTSSLRHMQIMSCIAVADSAILVSRDVLNVPVPSCDNIARLREQQSIMLQRGNAAACGLTLVL